MKFPVRAEVRRPAAQVFEKLSDCRNEAIWNSQVSSVDLLTDEPITVGTAFKTINRGKEYRATITVRDQPNRVEFDVTGRPMDLKARYQLHERGDSTTVEGELELLPKGILRVILPLTRRFIQSDLDKQYRSFASFCEST